MDAKVKKALDQKIDEAVASAAEIAKIQQSLGKIGSDNQGNLAFGIAIGRIYNSFHYQTRRILKRNATDKEFEEFLRVLASRVDEIINTLAKLQK